MRIDPGTVAIAGRSAINVSSSGVALSSERQNAVSSSKAATTVNPRTERNELVVTSIAIPFVNSIVSSVSRRTNWRRTATCANMFRT
jgi:hypothetical protein